MFLFAEALGVVFDRGLLGLVSLLSCFGGWLGMVLGPDIGFLDPNIDPPEFSQGVAVGMVLFCCVEDAVVIMLAGSSVFFEVGCFGLTPAVL